MTLDVVVPAVRTATLSRLLWSLAQGSIRPDMVSVVSNEVDGEVETHGLEVRVLLFSSERYPFGAYDLALRRNVGIFYSACSHVVTFDDDQIAPRTMLAAVRGLLEDRPYVWGHHRYASFARFSPEALIDRAPRAGRTREHPPNAWHLWQSCYGGMFAAERALLERLGGFDMIFSGRQAGEDQNLGRRIARAVDGRERVFIHEPPFAWHPEENEAWPATSLTNLCSGSHQLGDEVIGDVRVRRCRSCPYLVADDYDSKLFGDEPVLPFDAGLVEVTINGLD